MRRAGRSLGRRLTYAQLVLIGNGRPDIAARALPQLPPGASLLAEAGHIRPRAGRSVARAFLHLSRHHRHVGCRLLLVGRLVPALAGGGGGLRAVAEAPGLTSYDRRRKSSANRCASRSWPRSALSPDAQLESTR